jgi:hypothetical protein
MSTKKEWSGSGRKRDEERGQMRGKPNAEARVERTK